MYRRQASAGLLKTAAGRNGPLDKGELAQCFVGRQKDISMKRGGVSHTGWSNKSTEM